MTDVVGATVLSADTMSPLTTHATSYHLLYIFSLDIEGWFKPFSPVKPTVDTTYIHGLLISLSSVPSVIYSIRAAPNRVSTALVCRYSTNPPQNKKPASTLELLLYHPENITG